MNFNIRVVFEGDRYGRNLCLTHKESEPMVEFYDADHKFTEWGQFVSRYCLSTIVNGEKRLCENGLCLDGGVPAWRLTGDQMKEAFETIKAECFFKFDSHFLTN